MPISTLSTQLASASKSELNRKIDTALEALDILMDSADSLRLFELRAIADNAYHALYGYVQERDDREPVTLCEPCTAGYHETAGKTCECACHPAAHPTPSIEEQQLRAMKWALDRVLPLRKPAASTPKPGPERAA
jgi:hypothetical protein